MTDISEMRQVYLVTVGDGSTFQCEPRFVRTLRGSLSYRWSIQSKTTQYVGPVVGPDKSPEAVRILVEEWWAMKKALGQDAH